MAETTGVSHVHIPAALLALNIRSAYELVTLALVVAFGSEGLYLSHGKLAKILHVDRRSAIRMVQRLAANGRVVIEQQAGRRIIKPSGDIVSLLASDKLSPGVVTDGSLALVTGESPPSKQNREQKNSSVRSRARKRRGKTFTPPTVEEVREYATAQGYPDFDAEHFVEHYALADWRDKGGKPIRVWKQTLLGWLRRDKEREGSRLDADGKPRIPGATYSRMGKLVSGPPTEDQESQLRAMGIIT